MRDDWVGSAEVQPREPVVAGSWGTWDLRYRVGEYGLDDGGTVKVCWRFASDWGTPQFDDPSAPNYTTVATDGAARVAARWEPKGFIRPWQKCVVVDVFDDCLAPGDTITIAYGDRSGGSRGSRAQTFCEYSFEFRVVVDCFGTGQFIEVSQQPTLEIVSGPAVRLAAQLPSEATVRGSCRLLIKAEDEWGNPARSYEGTVQICGAEWLSELPEAVEFRGSDGGVRSLVARVRESASADQGVKRITVTEPSAQLEAESNPLRIVPAPEPYAPYWGEPHGQSEETVGTNTVRDYFRFARDDAGVDWCSHQGNDFQITPEHWGAFQAAVNDYYTPGEFATLLGYEWSAITAAGGDHNVHFRSPEARIRRTSHCQIAPGPTAPYGVPAEGTGIGATPPRMGSGVADKSDVAYDCYPIEQLFDALRGENAFMIDHVGGRRAHPDRWDDELVPLVEIYSAWGRFEWLFEEALQRGRKVGVVAGSDGHKGRPGASYPGASTFGVYGGLTCAYAEALTREAIWDALQARRCYATTGQRIILRALADGHWMGEEYAAAGPVRLSIEAHGTAPIEWVQVRRGLDVIHEERPGEATPLSDRRVRIAWGGARIRGRKRASVWDGELTLSEGRITGATGYAFDSPAEGIIERGERRVGWRSITTGDEDGVVLELDAPPTARLAFRTALVSFQLPLAKLTDGPFRADAGGVEQRVTVERLPQEPGRRSLSFEIIDHPPPLPAFDATAHAYHVRLKQYDGAMAWSSPIFVRPGTKDA